MAATPFKFTQLFRTLKCRNFQKSMGQGSGSNFFKQFSSHTAGYSKSRFEFYFRKNASNKTIFQIFALLIKSSVISLVGLSHI